MSDLSGPPPTVPPQELRRTAEGLPQLPAQNAGYLGKSLFTDYLLPVELGGTLLLVAAIGAVAIAHRRAAAGRMP
jgi:NADH:ubiquinone oxidoreductase subunit 6 (subunit J)